MQSVPKKVGKRRTDSPISDKETKVNKVETAVKVKKSATKAELIIQLEKMHMKYDALEKENLKNLEIITNLKENNAKSGNSCMTSPKETQTENDCSLKCIECNFVSVSTEEWKWHMYENHGWPNTVEIRPH